MIGVEAVAAQFGVPIMTYAVVFLRVGAAAVVLPGFGERAIPARIRLVAALAMALAVTTAAPFDPPEAKTVSDWAALILSESLVGLFLGLALRFLVTAVQVAGAIAAQSTSLAQISPGAFPDPLPALGQLLTMAALTLAFVMGLHVKTIVFLLASYDLFPVGRMPLPAILAEAGIRHAADCFALGLQLAAPFVLLSVIYNLVLGAVNRAMPQLMVAFVGAPLITWGSIALLLLSAPVALTVWSTRLDQFFATPFEATR